MAAWQSRLSDEAVEALVVFGPELSGPAEQRRVLALHPPSLSQAAQALAQNEEFATLWRQARTPLVAWQQIAGPAAGLTADSSPWRGEWLKHGLRTVMRIAFALPAGRAFECFMFSSRELHARSAAAVLTLSAFDIWPVLRTALVAAYSPLTPRELECLELAFDGLTARASAARMACTERTVNFHLANAMAKLQVDNKMAAIQRACWLGAI